MADGWTGWHELNGTLHFNVTASHCLKTMTRRQFADFYNGLALIAAAFTPDERFIDGDTSEQRAASIRLDERLANLLHGKDGS